MIAVISPAKSMNFEQQAPFSLSSDPHFQKDADYLAARLAKLKPSELAALMKISPKLAGLNAERYSSWKSAPLKQALFAYDGDVYDGLHAGDLTETGLVFAQQHLRILSGLYGYLQPLDLIKPYRIEMSTPFATPKGENLYRYWNDRITARLKKDLKESGTGVLINLASQEYFSALNRSKLKARIITPSFLDRGPEGYRMASFFAKRARGMMSRFILQNHITDFEMLVGFDEGGYRYNHGLSKGDSWVFTRG
jgi:uncharacterized protein